MAEANTKKRKRQPYSLPGLVHASNTHMVKPALNASQCVLVRSKKSLTRYQFGREFEQIKCLCLIRHGDKDSNNFQNIKTFECFLFRLYKKMWFSTPHLMPRSTDFDAPRCEIISATVANNMPDGIK